MSFVSHQGGGTELVLAEAGGSRWFLSVAQLWLLALAISLLAFQPGTASASGVGSLALSASGLPRGSKALVVLRGAGVNRTIRFAHTDVSRLQPGRYLLTLHTVAIGKSSRQVRAGAVAFPARRRLTVVVRSGHETKANITYAGVVNPNVRPMPRGVVRVVGDREDPAAMVLSGGGPTLRIGTILVSGPSPALPFGLISKVTAIAPHQGKFVVSLAAVPISEAVPELNFKGNMPLRKGGEEGGSLARSGSTALKGRGVSALSAPWPQAQASSACRPPALVKFRAHLDRVELRQASLEAWPPQMRMTLAVRSTEALGVSAAAVGINCDWTLGEIGPFQGAIPIGPIVIPVYVTVPVKAGVHINGRLNVGTINIASTIVATAAAGAAENRSSLSQQGSNVWLSGSPSISGDAKLSASVGVQAGIGVAKGANVHIEADFGPQFNWSSGHSCDLVLNLGALSAGVTVLGHDLNTPRFTPLHPLLWRGCQDTASKPGSGSGHGAGGGNGSAGNGGGGGADDSGGAQVGGSELTDVLELGGGSFMTCAARTGGSVACWGANAASGAHSATPITQPHLANVTSLKGGLSHFCAVLANETAACWGRNDHGELGDGTNFSNWSEPSPVVGLSGVKEVSSGAFFSCALLSSGHVSCWGDGEDGQLGNGGTAESTVPVPVSEIEDATELALGTSHACALMADGTVRCWGLNSSGELGDDSTNGSAVPVNVAGVKDAASIGSGDFHSCAVLTNGEMRCWGDNYFGELGNGTSSVSQSTAVAVTGIDDAVSMAGGFLDSCALLKGGEVKCWGRNADGELGNGTTEFSLVPVAVQGLSEVSEITVGEQHACARIPSGVYCWGSNQYGQLGNGGGPSSLVPTPVSAPS